MLFSARDYYFLTHVINSDSNNFLQIYFFTTYANQT